MTKRARRRRVDARVSNRFAITSVANFLGSHLCTALLTRGHEVVGIDCIRSGRERMQMQADLATAIARGLEFHEIDIACCSDLASLLRDVDTVFHMAGYPRTDDNENNLVPPALSQALSDEVLATSRVVDACFETRRRRLVPASSAHVSRDRPRVSMTGHSPFLTWTGLATAREQLVAQLTSSGRSRSVALRYGAVYGPCQRPEMAFARLVDAAIRCRDPIGAFLSSL